MVVFSSYAIQVVLSFMMLSMIFIIYPRASVSAQRILEVLETETKIKDGNKTHNDAIQTLNDSAASLQAMLEMLDMEF